ncbi:MAG: hypothetical protein IPP71_20590 [Bacteroidetes bacterium]|nr:hypothetical protein [Bacteroidota bacterium]
METSTGSFQNTAITLRGFSSTSGAVEVFNNNLTDYRIGIHAINLNNLKIGGYDINNNNPVPNYICFNVNNGTNLTNPHTGIWLQIVIMRL